MGKTNLIFCSGVHGFKKQNKRKKIITQRAHKDGRNKFLNQALIFLQTWGTGGEGEEKKKRERERERDREN